MTFICLALILPSLPAALKSAEPVAKLNIAGWTGVIGFWRTTDQHETVREHYSISIKPNSDHMLLE
jgi:hypothetical protein